MSDNFFEESTEAIGTIVTIILLTIVFSIIFLG